jgi:penicillin-insensitive murein endopeptidase
MKNGWRAILLMVAIGCAKYPEQPPRGLAASDVRSQRLPSAENGSQNEPARLPYPPPAHKPESDHFEQEEPAETMLTTGASVRPHPLDGKSEAELETLMSRQPEKLGSISVGRPNGGALLNAVQFEPNARCEVVDPNHAWGTRETIEFLRRSIDSVHRQFPDSPKLYLGHISSRQGGALSPHVSHQSGRDVDISYFYRESGRWYARANGKNLDVERTWAFVRALIAETDVEMILIDHSIQALLRKHAQELGENTEWLDDIFRGRAARPAIVRHARGHGTHMHIRFYNPLAQETGRRLHRLLVESRLIDPPTRYVRHKAKNGDTLGKLARRYGTSVEAIQRANGLRNSRIMARRSYNIPRAGGVEAPTQPLAFPPRRVPPPRRASQRKASETTSR